VLEKGNGIEENSGGPSIMAGGVVWPGFLGESLKSWTADSL
jgi:hypothetical protein